MSDDALLALVHSSPDEKEQQAILIGKLHASIVEGYPVDNLRRLLHSDRPDLVAAGTYVLFELGSAARPLKDELPRLLTYPSDEVRSLALQVALVCTERDAPELAQAVKLLADPTASVRARAVSFLAHATSLQLNAALEHLRVTRDPLALELTWFVEQFPKLLVADPIWSEESLKELPIASKLIGTERSGRLIAAALVIRNIEMARRLVQALTRFADKETSEIAARYR